MVIGVLFLAGFYLSSYDINYVHHNHSIFPSNNSTFESSVIETDNSYGTSNDKSGFDNICKRTI